MSYVTWHHELKRRLRKRTDRQRGQQPKRRFTKPLRLEALEDRRMLATLFQESFEAPGPTYDSGKVTVTELTAAVPNNSISYFKRTDGSDIETAAVSMTGFGPAPYTGEDGSFYFAAQGTEIPLLGGASDERTLEINGINIVNHDMLTISGLFAADGVGSGTYRYDQRTAPNDPTQDDHLRVFYEIDNSGTFLPAIQLEAEVVMGDETNRQLHVDANFDGIGDGGDQIVPAFRLLSFAIPSTGSNLDIRIDAQFDFTQEDVAFDNIMVTGNPTAPPDLLSASLVSGDLVIDEAGGGTADDLTLSFDGTDYTIMLAGVGTLGDGGIAGATGGGTGTITIPAASITGDEIIINSGGGDDTLTIDFGDGTNPLNREIVFNGEGQTSSPNGDTLSLTGTGSLTNAVYNFDNANDGDLDFDGQLITYTGLEPVTSSINATNVTLNYSTTSETLTVTDATGGQTRVTSDVAAETVTFNNPSGTLAINGGNTGDDIVNITSLAGSYPASLVIDGQSGAGDSINVNGALTFAAGKSLSLTAETIAVNQNVTSDTGVTVNVSAALGTGTATGVIGGAGTLTKDGAGTFTLSAANTFTGSTTISAGTLSISSDGNLGTAPGSPTAGHLVIADSATLDVTSTFTLNSNRGIAIGPSAGSGAGTIQSTGANTLTYGGVIANNGGGTGGLTLTATGATTFDLDGSSTYTGATTVDSSGFSGILTLRTSNLADGGSASGIGQSTNAAANLVFLGDSAVVNYDGAATSTDRLFTLGVGNLEIVSGGAGALDFTNTGALGFSGTGAVSLELEGASDGSFAPIVGDRTGGTTELIKADGGTWTVSGTNTYTGRTQITGGVLSVSSIANGGVASNIGASTSAATNLSFGGGATLRYTGATASTDREFEVTNTGATIDSSGTGPLSLTSTAAVKPTLLTLTGSNTGANTIAASLEDIFPGFFITSVAKSGAGTWGLTNAGSLYGGTTTITGGVLDVVKLADGGVASSIGLPSSAAANLTIDGGTLRYSGSGDSSDRLLTIGAGGATIDSSGTGALSLTSTGSPVFSGSGDRTLTLTGTSAGANSLSYALADSAGDVLSLTKNGTGTFGVNEATTFTGPTTVEAGTLAFSNVLNNNNVGGSATIDVQGGTFLDVTGLGSSRLDVKSGQTLQGTGTVTGAVTAESGSDISPGTSPGILSVGDFILSAGSDLNIEINGVTPGPDPGGHDQLDVTGTVTLAGTLVVTQPSGTYTPVGGEEFIIIDNDGTGDAVSGTFAGLAEGATVSADFLGSGLTATITYVGGDGNDVVIEVETGGSISGVKTEDIDGDGFAGSDPFLGGVKIVLWKDGGDGMFDMGGGDDMMVTDTTTSAVDGTYSFVDLAVGTYFVTEDPTDLSTAGLIQTDGGDSFPTTPYYTVALSGGTLSTGNDFANFFLGDISGVKLEDIDGDGFAGSDPFLGGVKIVLWKDGGDGMFDMGGGDDMMVTDTTTSGVDGTYSFGGLDAGTYFVAEDPTDLMTAGLIQTDGGDSFPTAPYYTVAITSGTSSTGNDFANFFLGDISGVKVEDIDGDGFAGSDPFLGGVKIVLWKDGGDGMFDMGGGDDMMVTDTTTSGVDGSYSFGGLDAGTYFVTEDPTDLMTAGLIQTDGGDSFPTAPYYTVAITSGTSSTGNDFANFFLGDISGVKVEDIDGDGFAGSDPFLGGVKIVLWKDGGDGMFDMGGGDDMMVTDTTSSGVDGSYSFGGLDAGTYFVTEDPTDLMTAGLIQTDGGDSFPTAPYYTVAITSGTSSTGNDFANFFLGDISGVKLEDIDGDGFAGSDPFLGGVKIVLWKDGGDGMFDMGGGDDMMVTDTTSSGVDGSYSFGGLDAGTYFVTEDPTDLMTAGLIQTDGGDSFPTAPYYTVAITSGTSSTGNDFANFFLGDISGVKLEDIDGDGFAGSDPFLGGVKIVLWKDGGDGMFDMGGGDDMMVTDTTSSGVDGSYSFGGLDAGTYFVTEDPTDLMTAGLIQTDGGDSFPTAPYYTVAITSGTSSTGNDFANFFLGDISGVKLEDIDGDGFAGSDPFLGGVKIVLWKDGGDGMFDMGGGDDMMVTDTTSSGVDGSYSFGGLDAGTYFVTEDPTDLMTAGLIQTDGGDSFPTAPYYTVAITSGTSSTGNDFANFFLGDISGVKLEDIDGDGFAGSDPFLGGVKIVLWKDGGDGMFDMGGGDDMMVTDTTSSGVDGSYSFGGLDAGTYFVTEDPTDLMTAGLIQTDGGDSFPTAPYYTVAITSGTSSTGNDFANFFLGDISGVKLEDIDGDGFAGSDPFLGGVKIVLWKDGGDGMFDMGGGDDMMVTDTTSSGVDGSYSFGGLDAGTYFVTEDPTDLMTAGLIQTDGGDSFPTAPYYTVAITSGTSSTGNDFANFFLGDISGVKLEDIDGDGFAGSDPFLGGVKIVLWKDGGDGMFDMGGGDDMMVTDTTSSGVDGSYSFGGLDAGTYFVTEDPTDLMTAGLIQTDGGDSFPTAPYYTVAITSGTSSTGNDFANFFLGDISGVKLEDIDGDGFAGSDPFLGGVKIVLWKDGGDGMFDMGAGDDMMVTDTTTSGVDGSYSFGGLDAGTYFVTEDPTDLMTAGLIQTDGGDSFPTAPYYTVAITSGTSSTGNDFANFFLGDISGVKLEDIDGDGFAGSDPFLGGVKIVLWKDGGDGMFDMGAGDDMMVTDTTTSGVDGTYSFGGLDAGTYFVTEDPTDLATAGLVQTDGGDSFPTAPYYTVAITSGTSSTGNDFANAFFDFGDAPDPLGATPGEYPTLLSNDGARHIVPSAGATLFLGVAIDPESDGQPDATATGDDTDINGDDEDGVTFPLLGGPILAAGELALVDVEASVAGGLLNAWVDFNANGVWEMSEQIFADEPLMMGTNNLDFEVPVDAVQGATFARFRLDSGGGLMPTGLATDGEVEDYELLIVGLDYGDAPDNGLLGIGLGEGVILGTKFEDLDGNGMGDVPLTGLLDEGGAPTGVAIELFLDRDTDGVFEPGADDGDAVLTTLTDFTTGDFLFLDLPTGVTFFVREQPTSLSEFDLIQTAGGDDFPGGVDYYTVVLTAGSPVSVGNNFANFFGATIDGTKFEDLTNDGPTGDDTPLDAVSLQLFADVDGDGMFEPGGDDNGTVATAFTPADGTYSFSGLGPGTYFVREDPVNPGLTQTGGGDDFGGGTDFYTVVIDDSGEVVSGLDFTNFISDEDARRDAVGGGGTGAGGPTRDVFEPNDSIAEAEVTPLMGTGSHTLEALIGDGAFGMTTGDYDFYKFTAAAGDTIDITATEILSSGLDTFIALYDMSGTELASNDDASAMTTDSELSFVVGPAGMYFALVFGAGSGLPADATMTGNGTGAASTGAYELLIEINAPATGGGGVTGGMFPTLNSSDGARHVLVPGGPVLGAAVDGEDDGQPTIDADGDDVNGDTPDDEDGVVFTSVIVPGTMATVDVTVAPGLGGLLSAWIDFNANLEWDPSEQIFTDVSLAAGMTHSLMFSVPVSGVADTEDIYSRFRFSTDAGLMPSGFASDGEVEDYLVTLAEFDFGDAPDFVAGGGGGGVDDDGGAGGATFDYPTLTISDGARHVLVDGGPTLGAAIDSDEDGQPTSFAIGDDTDMDGDDEDGVVFTSALVAGGSTTVEVTVTGAAGSLNAWVDFDRNGSWDAGEQIFIDEPVSTGAPNMLSFSVPAGAIDGISYARFRLDSTGGLSYDGQADDGEVEDYVVIIGEADYGDAPDPLIATDGEYPTLLLNDGPFHALDGTTFLGTSVDADLDGQPDATATGDDLDGNNDDDGVTLLTTLVVTETVNTTASVVVDASVAGMLDAWIDFNFNGVFDHPSEHLAGGVSVSLSAGPNLLNFVVPSQTDSRLRDGDTFARLRFSTAGSLLPTGVASDGEVEDYIVTVVDGDGTAAAVVDSDPVVGDVNITTSGSDVVVEQDGGLVLFQAPISSIATLEFNGTANTETVNVLATDASVATTINAGDGSDRIMIGNAAKSLDDIQGPVTVDGGAEAPGGSLTVKSNALPWGDRLILGDQMDFDGDTYDITPTQIDRSGAALITYTMVETLQIGTGAGEDVVTADTAASVNTILSLGGDNDTVTITGTGANANLIVKGLAGRDEVIIQATSAGSATQIEGGDWNDITRIGNASNSLDDILGEICVLGDAHFAASMTLKSNSLALGDRLVVSDQGDADGNTYDVTPTQISRAGAALITYESIETLHVSAGAGEDIFTAETAANVNTFLHGGAAKDAITITGTGANANTTINGKSGNDVVTIQATAAGSVTQVNGGDGSDATRVGNASNSLDDILGEVCFDGAAHAAASLTLKSNSLPWGDRLILNDFGDADGNTYDVTPTQIDRAGAALITYSTVETLKVNAGNGADVVTADTAPSVNTILNLAGDDDTVTITGTGANANTIVNGNAGNDEVFIHATSAGSVTEVNGGNETDVTHIGDTANWLAGILGEICVNGDNHPAGSTTLTIKGDDNTLDSGDVLNINDHGTSAGLTYTLDDTTLQRSGAALITYGTIESLNLNAAQGVNDIDILTTAANVNTTVTGGGDVDAVEVTTTGAGSNVVIEGAGGNDTIDVTTTGDSSFTRLDGGADNDQITVSNSGGAGAHVELLGDAGDDVLSVAATGAGSSTALDGGSGVNSFILGAGIQGDLCVIGMGTGGVTRQVRTAGGFIDTGLPYQNNSAPVENAPVSTTADDTLILDFSTDTLGVELRLDGTTLALPGVFNIDYSGVETIEVLGGSGDDLLRVEMDLTPVVTFDGGGGADTLGILGTGGDDNIVISPITTDPAVRAPFEMDNVECVHVEAGAGNDFVFNDTAAESLLNGDIGDDILLGGSGVDILFGHDGLDAMFGNGGDDFLFSDQAFDGTLFFNDGELLNGGAGTDVGTDNTLPDVLVDLETIQFPSAATMTLNAAALTCDFTDLVTGDPIVFEVPTVVIGGGPLVPGLNTLTISNALAGAVVVLLQGTNPGSQVVTVQGQQLHTGLADAVPVALSTVDPNGVATVVINVTAAQLGQTLLFQAFQVLPEVMASVVVSLGAGPLMASGGEGPGAAAVSPSALPALIEEAIARWEAAGISPEQSEQIRAADIELTDLPDGLLGRTVGNMISIDGTGAGYGWFVDSTAAIDEEFPTVVAPTESQATAKPAADRMDLLTALMHEFGHVLDLPDAAGDSHTLMGNALPLGVRRYALPQGEASIAGGARGSLDADATDATTVRQDPTSNLDLNLPPLDAGVVGRLAGAKPQNDDPAGADSFESILDEIAGDIWEHWSADGR